MTAPEQGEDLSLRPATDVDVEGVVDVYLAAGSGPGHPPERRDRAGVRRWLARRVARDAGHEVWVAVREDVVVGFVDLQGRWVSLLFVDPGHQRHGVGSALVMLLRGLRPGGFGLRVHADNQRARAFYAAHDLVELERTDGSAYDDGWPDVRLAWPGEEPLRYWRGAIDELDADLAVLLARRVALAGAVQDHKAAAGEPAGVVGRDPAREAEIVHRMARRVPSLDPARLERVMAVVLEEGLADWHERRDPAGDAV